MLMHTKEKKKSKLDWESWVQGWGGIAMLKMSNQLSSHDGGKLVSPGRMKSRPEPLKHLRFLFNDLFKI